MNQSPAENRPAWAAGRCSSQGQNHQEEAGHMSRQPKRDLRRRQQRRRKVKALRDRLENTTNPEQRRHLIAKIKKISPTAPVPSK